ncbi:ABC transporter permease [Bacillus sp. 2205SS5-2]|uniref:ABC transporter permease n=1 Tax=Bacillus sp. 2205SS5-2 TaxID=3109031 RepID=UPI0030068C48
MNNFLIMLLQTYSTKFKSKQFLITTLLIAGAIFLLVNFENIISALDDEGESQTIAVLDNTNELFDSYQAQISEMNQELILEKSSADEESLEKKVEAGDYSAYLILSYDEQNLPQGVYKAISVTDSSLSEELRRALQVTRSSIAAQKLDLSAEKLAVLSSIAPFEKVALSESAKTEEELNQARGLVYVLLFFIYFAVIMYANMIAVDVANEKSSRVMEILISSVSPVQQMFAKILGIGLLGLTQMAVWLGAGYFAISGAKGELSGGFFEFMGFENTPPLTIFYAVVFFLLGYFLFATLAALLGSLVSRVEDVQQVVMPMTFIIIIGFLISMVGLGDPESPFITITSFIPIFTPMVMFLRVGMLNIPAWEILLSISLLAGTIFAFAIFGARVYRGGVLMYGKSTPFKNIRKALQLSKKE